MKEKRKAQGLAFAVSLLCGLVRMAVSTRACTCKHGSCAVPACLSLVDEVHSAVCEAIATQKLCNLLPSAYRNASPGVATSQAAAAPCGSEDDVDWVDGLGEDVVSIILQHAGVAATGAAACVCRTLKAHAMQEDIWQRHFQSLSDHPCYTSRASGSSFRAQCEFTLTRRRFLGWQCDLDGALHRIEEARLVLEAQTRDAAGRLSKLKNPDYREAQQLRDPPLEFTVAAALLRATLEDGAESESRTPTTCDAHWLQSIMPQIAGKHKAISAQSEVARFLSLFHAFEAHPEPVSAERLARLVAVGVEAVCLRKIDEVVQCTLRTRGFAGPQASALIVASGVTRWVVAHAGRAMVREREIRFRRLLGAVNDEAGRRELQIGGGRFQGVGNETPIMSVDPAPRDGEWVNGDDEGNMAESVRGGLRRMQL